MPKILTYFPVLHQGYLDFLNQHQEADELLILGAEIIATIDHLQRKDIRAIDPEKMVAALSNLSLPFKIRTVSFADLKELNSASTVIIAPQEDELKNLIEKHLNQAQVKYDSQFLRWDRSRSKNKKSVETTATVTHSELDQKLIQQSQQVSQLSADWWRQVGALIAQDDQVLLTGYNHHVPHPQQPYVNGDPRGLFHKGEYIELSTAVHAEAGLIAKAAQQGLSLEGASMYVTTFPCPNCAKLIAYSGIKKLYFSEGYSLLDGEQILKRQGVEIYQVKDVA